MKSNAEIKELSNLIIHSMGDDGGQGEIIYGSLKASVIWASGAGWDHVSISPKRKRYIPTWEEMCKLKEMFFYPEETVIQYHPAESQHINQMSNCLHLWRPQKYELPLPPRILVGLPKDITMSQVKKEVKEAYEKPYALTSGMVDGSRDK